jgi:lipid-binding SYLF domain-containing protein
MLKQSTGKVFKQGSPMKTNQRLLDKAACLIVSFTIFSMTAWASADKDEPSIQKRLEASAEILDEVMGAPDRGIPEEILRAAKCVAVVPSMVKFAVGVGGHYGKGLATCRTADGAWSAPAPIVLTGGSWGLQFGGQAVDLVMVVMTPHGMQRLLSSKFKIGVAASAAAGPVGRHAEAGTDWKMNTEILTYSRARGIFAGIDLSGSVIKQDSDGTELLFGKMVPFSDILNRKVSRPKSAREFLATVTKFALPTTPRG